jgi:hypothetical protein
MNNFIKISEFSFANTRIPNAVGKVKPVIVKKEAILLPNIKTDP